jgi:hypothetical protein
MYWWDAVSACTELGNKKLLSVEDMVIPNDDDTPAYLSSEHTKTALGEALYDQGWNRSGEPHIWSSVLYDACRAYNVSLPNGSVYYNARNSNHFTFYAVCR